MEYIKAFDTACVQDINNAISKITDWRNIQPILFGEIAISEDTIEYQRKIGKDHRYMVHIRIAHGKIKAIEFAYPDMQISCTTDTVHPNIDPFKDLNENKFFTEKVAPWIEHDFMTALSLSDLMTELEEKTIDELNKLYLTSGSGVHDRFFHKEDNYLLINKMLLYSQCSGHGAILFHDNTVVKRNLEAKDVRTLLRMMVKQNALTSDVRTFPRQAVDLSTRYNLKITI